ncbi:MAG: YfhO family protein [Chloroflexota bacterium]|nr:YfhO family protein [Chloroflexota bacterium]
MKLPQGHSRLPIVILAGAVAIVMYRLFLGEVLFWGLPALQFYPWRSYGFELARDLTLPLWNPFNGAGAPLLANYQSALLYPLHWFGVFLPLGITMSVTAALHLVIAGWGMWRLGVRLGFTPLGAGVSAIAFGMSGYLFARLHTFPTITAAAWLPWLIWAVYGLVTARRVRDGGWLALFTALLLLAGHAQTAWYTLLLAGLFTLWLAARGQPTMADGVRLIGYRENIVRRVAPFLAAAGCVLLGAGAAATQLLPTAELLGQSQRSGGVDYWTTMNFSYDPVRTLNWLAPSIFGTPADGSYFTQGSYFEDAVYVGLIPLFLSLAAVVAFVRRRHDPERPTYFRHIPFWLIIVVVGFVFALGRHSPIFPFLYENVPTFDLFQAPVRWHLWTVFGICLLAGSGATAWARGLRTRRRARVLLVACVGALIMLIVALVVGSANSPILPILIRALFVLFISIGALCVLTLMQPESGTPKHARWVALVWLIAAFDLAYAAWGLNPTVPAAFYDPLPPTNLTDGRGYWSAARESEIKFDLIFRFDDYRIAADGWAGARQTQLPNLNLIDRVSLLNNFDPLLPDGLVDTILRIETSANPRKLLRAAGVDRAFDLGELMDAPRAWLVAAVCWHQDAASLDAALMDSTWNPDAQAHGLGDGGCPTPTSARVGDVTRLRDESNVVTVEVEAAYDSWLILADTDYPGWMVTVDGEPAPIYRANGAFRMVQVDAGSRVVRFEYQPAWLLPGVFISVISILGTLILFRVKSSTTPS